MDDKLLKKALDIIKAMPKEAEPNVQCQEYSWAVPHYFREEHEAALNEFVALLTKNISTEFSKVCHNTFSSKFLSISQHWGNSFINEILTDHNQYYVEIIGSDNKVCGILVIPKATATMWIASALMDIAAKQDEKEKMSSIEQSLLLDVSDSVVNGLANSLVSRGCSAVKASNKILGDRFILKIGDIQELVEINFAVLSGDHQMEASIVLFSQVLDNVAGIIQRRKQSHTPEAVSAAIIRNIGKTIFNITAELGTAYLKMSQLLQLQSDDILLLDKTTDEKVSVLSGSQTIAYGWPVQSKGKLAVQVEQ